MSGQGSGCRGQHLHHLCLCVHISHHDKATHRALYDTLSSPFLSVLCAAHAQHMIRKVSPWSHRHQLQLCVVLRHSQGQTWVRDGWCSDLVDADIWETYFIGKGVKGHSPEAVEILADLLIASIPSALLGALHHASGLREEHNPYKVREVSFEFIIEPLMVQHQHHVHLKGRGTVDQSLVSRALHPPAGVDDAASHAGLPVHLTALGIHLGQAWRQLQMVRKELWETWRRIKQNNWWQCRQSL